MEAVKFEVLIEYFKKNNLSKIEMLFLIAKH